MHRGRIARRKRVLGVQRNVQVLLSIIIEFVFSLLYMLEVTSESNSLLKILHTE
ncbi:hypothetical protein [Peribacillus sp. NPDC097895]|uniref:hypothetical protein n=1 Tax=Peribacillus sp. NPDC097895 TaxID=3390619 RepID=UPI003D05E954